MKNRKLIEHKATLYSYLAIAISISCIILSGCSSSVAKHDNTSFNRMIKSEQAGNELSDSLTISRIALDHFIEGSKLQLQNKYAESILEFQEAIKYDSSASILFAMAQSYKELNKYAQAQDLLLAALSRQNDLIPAMELLVEVYMAKYQLDKAIKVMEEITALEPTFSRKYTLARLYEYQSLDKAIKLYEELIEKAPNDATVVQRLLILYKQNKEEDNYLKYLRIFADLDPNNLEPVYNLVLELTNKNEFENAFAVIKKAELSNSSEEMIPVYTLYGASLTRDTTEKTKEYVETFVDIIIKKYNNEIPLNVLGGYLSQMIGRQKQSEEFFRNALAKADTMRDLPLEIANYCFRQKNYTFIVDMLTEFSPKYPEDIRYPLTLSYCYSYMEEFDKSLEFVRKALVIDSLNIDALTHEGFIYDKLKDIENSFKTYEKVLQLQPLNAQVNNNYAYALSELNRDLEKAKKMSLSALMTDSTNASYLDTYGWINFKLGNLDEAFYYIMKAISIDSLNPEEYEHLGEIYLAKNEKELALNAFLKALELDADNVIVKEKIEKLKTK